MFTNYINSLAVDSKGNIWAAGSLLGTSFYTWISSVGGSDVSMTGSSASANSVVLKIESDFTLNANTFMNIHYDANFGAMPNSKFMRQTRNAGNTANVTAVSAADVPRAVFLGVAVGIVKDEPVVYAVGYQKNVYLYDHGNGKPTAAQGTGNHDKPVVVRF